MVIRVVEAALAVVGLILAFVYLPTLLSRSCMECDGRRFKRSRQRSSLEVIAYLLFLPYRCDRCAARSFRFRFVDMGTHPPPVQHDQSTTAFTMPASR